MARTVHKEKHAVKRKEILDVAQRFVYTKGYEQMSIQDILGELQISKGAFYHYFNSKGDLLEALIEQMRQEVEPIILPVVNDPDLPTFDKLHHFFDTAARWKTARKEYILSLLRVWYADDNAIVRQKASANVIKWAAPLLAQVIRQGMREGVLTTLFPDQVGEILLALLQSLGDAFMELFVSSEPQSDKAQRAASLVAGYNDAMERMLGAPPGSLNLIDGQTLQEWFVS
ncbi:HTH-type transcriptional regulator TtgR [Thermoflexales bacterium]|nr:HTH-type transcriptional regulator TtgR [Thermoflexales bacterium]